MEKLIEKDFVRINEEIALCIYDTKYKDFNVKSGMVIVDGSLAKKVMVTVSGMEDCTDIKDSEEDVIVSYIDEDLIAIWISVDGEWRKSLVSIIDDCKELEKSILSLCYCGENIIDIISNRYDYGELYTGGSFRVWHNRDSNFYYDYIKTPIWGLYKVCCCGIDDTPGHTCYEWVKTKMVGDLVKRYELEGIDTDFKEGVVFKVIEEVLERDDEEEIFFDEIMERCFRASKKNIEIAKGLANDYLRKVNVSTVVTALNILYSKLGCELIVEHDKDDVEISRFSNGLLQTMYKQGSDLNGQPCTIVKFMFIP